MAVQYEIDAARTLVRSSANGTLTDEELRVHTKAMGADPAFDPSYRHLFDLTGITDLEVTSQGLRSVRELLPWTQPTRRALVCSSDVVFGMARMAEMLNDEAPSEIRVFRDMAEALRWLELDSAEDAR